MARPGFGNSREARLHARTPLPSPHAFGRGFERLLCPCSFPQIFFFNFNCPFFGAQRGVRAKNGREGRPKGGAAAFRPLLNMEGKAKRGGGASDGLVSNGRGCTHAFPFPATPPGGESSQAYQRTRPSALEGSLSSVPRLATHSNMGITHNQTGTE